MTATSRASTTPWTMRCCCLPVTISGGSRAIEMQVFESWFYACYPKCLIELGRMDEVFPGIAENPRAEQKRMAIVAIARARAGRAAAGRLESGGAIGHI